MRLVFVLQTRSSRMFDFKLMINYDYIHSCMRFNDDIDHYTNNHIMRKGLCDRYDGFALFQLWSILAVGGTDPLTNRTLLSRTLVDGFLDADPPSIDRVLGVLSSFGRGMKVEKSVVGIALL